MKTLYVRVDRKAAAQKFFRCGHEFGKAWKMVGVDEATAQRLEEEQMLEVAATAPADYEPDAAAAAEAAAAAPVAAKAKKAGK